MGQRDHQLRHQASLWHSLAVFATALALLLLNFSAHADSENSLKNRIKIRKKSRMIQEHMGNVEEYNQERFELLATKRRNIILDIKHVLASHHDEEQKAELNMRLGSLYMEDYYSKLSKAQAVF